MATINSHYYYKIYYRDLSKPELNWEYETVRNLTSHKDCEEVMDLLSKRGYGKFKIVRMEVTTKEIPITLKQIKRGENNATTK